ncbi:MAG: DNA phosphorothioation-dependent restriction protein DptF [Paludibacteraceae bacterium]|nr:DNA phosphorothioation-dependent restriction protein DptF [Paludibacteraceae bacterium]
MSKITELFKQLNRGSLGSVQNGCQLSELTQYLNVNRMIENNIEGHLKAIQSNGGGLLLLIGNAGDGKSHIISKLKASGLYNDFEFYNDATASCSPKISSIDTLKMVLRYFDDEHIGSTNKKMLLAINLGKLNEFIGDENFSKIGGIAKNVLSERYEKCDQKNYLRYISFSNQQNFELTQDGTEYPIDSSFIREVLDKITVEDNSNPFYQAYCDTAFSLGDSYPEVINYKLLSLPSVKNTITKLIIEAIIRFQLIFTPRDFFDFLCSIIIFPFSGSYKEGLHFFESLLPTLIFEGKSSKIQRAVNLLDPLRVSSLEHNKELSVLFTAFKLPKESLDEIKLGELYIYLKDKINFYYRNHGKDTERISKLVFRLNHLLEYKSESPDYKKYLSYLSRYNDPDTRYDVINELEEMINICIPRHYGAYLEAGEMIPLNIQGSKYRLFARIEKEMANVDAPYLGEYRNEFLLYIPLEWEVKNTRIPLKMDYQLFEYISSLEKGKLAITYESELNIEFSRYIRELIKNSASDKEVIVISSDNKHLSLKSRINNAITLS